MVANREIHITTQLINPFKFNMFRGIIYSEAQEGCPYIALMAYKEICITIQHIIQDKFTMFREIIYRKANNGSLYIASVAYNPGQKIRWFSVF